MIGWDGMELGRRRTGLGFLQREKRCVGVVGERGALWWAEGRERYAGGRWIRSCTGRCERCGCSQWLTSEGGFSTGPSILLCACASSASASHTSATPPQPSPGCAYPSRFSYHTLQQIHLKTTYIIHNAHFTSSILSPSPLLQRQFVLPYRLHISPLHSSYTSHPFTLLFPAHELVSPLPRINEPSLVPA